MTQPDDDGVARERLAVLSALAQVLDNRTEFVEIVSNCASVDDAATRLRQRFGFDDVQARAALDMQVARFAADGRAKIDRALAELQTQLGDAG